MAIPQQDILQNLPTVSGASIDQGLQGTDVEAFVIQVLDPETGNQIESLSLGGVNRPFAPVLTPVSQEIQKIYYPGNSNRVPTIQVMGPMDDNVRLEGVFEAHSIQDPARRDEPTEIVDILRRITEEGNILRFQIGPWIRYGFIENFSPQFITKAKYRWNMDLVIVGKQNPLQKNQDEEVERADRIFAAAELADLKDIRESVLKDIEDAKIELEDTNYLPIIRRELGIPFVITDWLDALRQSGPIGRVADVGSFIYDSIIGVSTLANEFLDNVDRFIQQTDQLSIEASKFILTIENLRSRIFRQSVNLYNTYSRISSSISTSVRISSFSPIASVGGVFFNLSSLLKDVERKARSSVNDQPIRTYVVKDNDTLQKISTKVYGDWNRWQEIRDANNLQNSDIDVDQILILPE